MLANIEFKNLIKTIWKRKIEIFGITAYILCSG